MTVIDGFNFGPLACLLGTWKGDKGMDIAPEPDGTEENPFYETIQFDMVGDLKNAESQMLVAISYHQVVTRKSNDKVFHDEMGYWMWHEESQTLTQSLIIPRAVAVMAGGKHDGKPEGDSFKLDVKAKLGDNDWGIVESPFMRDNASTKAFEHVITVEGDTMKYFEKTTVDIYGKTFEHTDENTLTRVK